MLTAVPLSLALRNRPEQYNVLIESAWNWLQQFLCVTLEVLLQKQLENSCYWEVLQNYYWTWTMEGSWIRCSLFYLNINELAET